MSTPKLPTQTVVAIFCRDEARCVYCDASMTEGASISVDHVIARSWGGDELDPTNLVCACKNCNDAKGGMDHVAFADMVERYPNAPAVAHFKKKMRAADIVAWVNAHRFSPLNPIAAVAALEQIRANRRAKK